MITPNVQICQLMSAVMDDEAHPSALQHLSIASQGDDAVRRQWLRYQLASSMLKRQVAAPCIDMTLADRVRAAVQDQDTHADCFVSVPDQSTWWQPLSSFAIAASVTVMIVLGLQQALTSNHTDVIRAFDSTDIVLMEPGRDNPQYEQASIGAVSGDNVAQVRKALSDKTLEPMTDAQWFVQDLPSDFVLLQRRVNHQAGITREMLRFSDGVDEFALYVELLMGRSIAEGHVYAGNNLVLGKSLVNAQGEMFVTLVGALPLAAAQQVVASVTAFPVTP
jgi:negative regulator of sigma E activity